MANNATWRVAPRTGFLFMSLIPAAMIAPPALAQDKGEAENATSPGDIIVTARRSDERLQDVPISISVFSPKQLADRNIISATDLATYTPSLTVNQRFGSEKASFVIRGFSQDPVTAPAVGIYFADVVGLRAQGGTSSGNSVGIGSFMDLQNVQILKGPQGTLFGRNTTGGAVLLVPNKPTDKLEGSVEGSLGAFDLKRVQATLNVPLADTFKVRMNVDRNKRDGFLSNKSGIGPDSYNDVNYFAARLSVLAELTPDLENYTIATYSHSFANGYAAKVALCATNPTAGQARLAPAACNQIARQNARGDGPFDVDVGNPDPFLRISQWQVINTTTWRLSDSVTLKNIVSYGEFRERTNFSLYGDNLTLTSPPLTAGSPLIGTPISAIILAPVAHQDNSAQSTVVEELQLQGSGLDSRLKWQMGAYFEESKPIGFSEGYTPANLSCTDISNLKCTNPLGIGSIQQSSTKYTFHNNGLYAQATLDITDRLAVTGGIRYSMDKTEVAGQNSRLTPTATGYTRTCADTLRLRGPTGGALVVNDKSQCLQLFSTKSNKPTWLIDFDYKPVDDLLLYAKWARGYRQGGINPSSVGLETWEPEKLDAYEAGAKLSLRGSLSGFINVAAFYNDFTNQQIAATLLGKPSSGILGILGIVNGGKSRIQGLEADGSVNLFEGLRLDVGYAYLDTKLKSITVPTLAPDSPFGSLTPGAAVGSALPLSPKNRVTATATYTLPLDESIGRIALGATFTHTDSQLFSQATIIQYRFLPKTDQLNLNATWSDILGRPIDVSFFMTNVTNQATYVAVGNSFNSSGFESLIYGQPRNWGFRLRYRFGD